MELLGKVLTSFITLAFAIVGGLWTAYTVLHNTMDSKVAEAKVEMRIERAAQIGELRIEIQGVRTLVQSIDGNVKILLEKEGKAK